MIGRAVQRDVDELPASGWIPRLVHRIQLGFELSVRWLCVIGSVPTNFFLFFQIFLQKHLLMDFWGAHRTGRDLM